MEDKKRLAWFILLRVVVVSFFLVSTIMLNVKEPGSLSDETLSGLFRLILATYLFLMVSLIVLRFTEKLAQSFTYVQLIWDLLLVTLLILLTGGINSPFSFLYILTIINASVLLARREAIYTASLCAILYGAIIDFQFFGKLGFLESSQVSSQHGANYVFYTISINILAYYLTAFLTGYLAERVRRSETALQEKVIDYEELERLNTAIVYNLDSGLLTLNDNGEIRVFNRYATELTGMTQEEAYDRHLSDIVPGLPTPAVDSLVKKGEIAYRSLSGSKLTLDYKTVPLLDREGNRAGTIVALQDITKLKRMEVQLKKADKLAAIGELSARIAHEIRNPLASISGSVQLMAQGKRVHVNDRKLLEIVMRETERLNKLVSDFLSYARPVQPVKIPIRLKQFLSDLSTLLVSDPRFEKVAIDLDDIDDAIIDADRDQLQQVFWNLFVNAAEAMDYSGRIKICTESFNNEDMGICLGEVVEISVSDTGKGMAKEDMKMVFEPFFTKKSGGSGLGLATVYRIIESHGGLIQVDSTVGKGSSFSIFLPRVMPQPH